jgi:hypothetical protein
MNHNIGLNFNANTLIHFFPPLPFIPHKDLEQTVINAFSGKQASDARHSINSLWY